MYVACQCVYKQQWQRAPFGSAICEATFIAHRCECAPLFLLIRVGNELSESAVQLLSHRVTEAHIHRSDKRTSLAFVTLTTFARYLINRVLLLSLTKALFSPRPVVLCN